MVGFILAIIAVAVSITITWSICSSKSNTNTGNQVSAASNTRITVTERTETGPMVYFADDRQAILLKLLSEAVFYIQIFKCYLLGIQRSIKVFFKLFDNTFFQT